MKPQTIFRRAGGLIIVLFIVYAPAMHGTLLWDDAAHVPDRPSLYTPAGLRQIWTIPGYVQQYYPLTFTTVWAAHHFWGANPVGYHVLTLLLHACNALLIVWLLNELGMSAVWWVAWLFALHPIEVESVAWISEIKNTQSTFFYLLALIVLLRFFNTFSMDEQSDRHRWSFYTLAFLFYLGALFTKTVTCTLPMTALILLWYQRDRLTQKDFVILTPFFLVGTILALCTAHWERTLIGAMGPTWTFSIPQRLFIAGHAFWFYIGKLLWPHPLIFVYQRWDLQQLALPGILSVSGIVGLLGCAAAGQRRWGRGPLAALLVFGVVLSPALGFANNYPMRYTFVADHYQYAAGIALITLLVAGVWRCLAPSIRKPVLGALCLVFAAMSWSRAHVFQNPMVLWHDTLAKNPNCMMAHANLASELLSQGEISDARQEAIEAFQTPGPDNMNMELVLGDIRLRYDHDPVAALQSFNRAYGLVQRLPLSPSTQTMLLGVHLFRSRAYFELKDFAEAQKDYAAMLPLIQALRARPFCMATPEILNAMESEVYTHLALISESEKKLPEAIEQLKKAERVEPNDPDLKFQRAALLMKNAQRKEAAEAYQQALALNPNSWSAQKTLGELLEEEGRFDEAIGHDRQAVTLNPDLKETRYRLAKLLLKQGRKQEALAEYQAAIQANPR